MKFNLEQRKAFDRAIVRIHCDELKHFVESTTDALEHAEGRFADFVEQTAQQMEDYEERCGFESAMADKGWLMVHDHPQRLFEACFLGAYFFLEDKMCRIAHSEWRRRGPALEMGDLKGQGIDGAKAVFTKICGYTLPNTSEWQRVCDYRDLRNCIVHRRGRIGQDKRLKKFIDANGLRSLRLPKGRIELNQKFCIEVIEVIGRYLDQLIDVLEEPSDNLKDV